jgi:hypothetical protein
MTKFLRILKELQELVESEGKSLTLEFEPSWEAPDVSIGGVFITGYPFTSPNLLLTNFQQEEEKEEQKDPVEEVNKLTLTRCMRFLRMTLDESPAERLDINLTKTMRSPSLCTDLASGVFITNPGWNEGVYEAGFKKPEPETIVVDGVTYKRVD